MIILVWHEIDTCFNFLCLFSAGQQAKQDKLLMELEKLKFLNGPSSVYKESRFVYLKQCGLYVEEYNVSKVRKSDSQCKGLLFIYSLLDLPQGYQYSYIN